MSDRAAIPESEQMNKRQKLQLLFLLLFNYFTFMMITTIIGYLIPQWKADFQKDDAIISLLNSAFFIAYATTSLPMGALADRVGSKNTFFCAAGLILVGSLLFALLPSFAVGIISLLIIGGGVTALQIVGNLLVKKIDSDPQKYSRNLTMAQAFTGIGAASGGPLSNLFLEELGMQWTAIYYFFGGLAIVMMLLVASTFIPESKEEQTHQPSLQEYMQFAARPMTLLFVGGIFLYVGIEVGVANWIVEFLSDNRGYNKVSAREILSFYWLAQMLGRFTGGAVLNYMAATKALILYALGCLLSLLLAVLLPAPGVSGIAFVLVGFFTSIIFPTIFSLAVNHFDKSKEKIVAGLLVMAIVGGAVTTTVIGFIRDLTGSLTVGLIVAGVLSYLYIAAVGVIKQRVPEKAAAES